MPGIKRKSGRYPWGSQRSFRENVGDYLSGVYTSLDQIGNDALDMRDEEVWKLTVKLKEDICKSDCVARVVRIDDEEKEVE